MQIIFLKDVWGFCLVFSKWFVNKKGVQGARFGDNFGSSKHVHKSIGICPEALISHLGTIKNHKNLPEQ